MEIDQITIDKRNGRYNPEQLADMIVLGLVSEEKFFEMNLSEKEVLEVFKNIRNQRNWQIDDEHLAVTIRNALK